MFASLPCAELACVTEHRNATSHERLARLFQVAQLRAALDNGREYTVPPEHDPSLLLLQGTHQLGVATVFTEPIIYMLATEVEHDTQYLG